jgi:hypothetical protein
MSRYKAKFTEIKEEYLEEEEWEDIALILKDALYRMEEEGWTQGHFYQADSQGNTKAYCAVGSVMRAVLERQRLTQDWDQHGLQEVQMMDKVRADQTVTGITHMLDALAQDYYLFHRGDGIVHFNDSSSTRQEHVTDIFRGALNVVQDVLYGDDAA